MASVELDKGKCDKGKALYGIPKHNFRDSKNHSNKDIDPTRSHLNKHYGPQSSVEFRDRLREMIKQCDAKKPPKRKKEDRKVMLAAVIPSPREGMTPEQEAAWSEKTWEIMNELFDGQIVGATYHADEIHKYLVNDEEHMSRGHTHFGLIPWSDEYGLNMDKFYRRDLPNRINEALDKACMEMFGFPFRDGTGKKGKKTVEELKKESEIAALDNQIDMMQNEILDTQDNLNSKKSEYTSLCSEFDEKKKELEEISKPYQDAMERLIKQYEALTPKQREKEKDIIGNLLKESKRAPFGDPERDREAMRKATAALEKESSRLESTYNSIESDDDFER